MTVELRAGLSYVNDPKLSAAYVVTLPEVLPVSEALELIEGLQQSSTPIGGVVLNRLPRDPFTANERAALDPLLASRPVYGTLAYKRSVTAGRALDRLRRSTDLPLLLVREYSRKGAELVEAILAGLHQPQARP